MTREEAKQALLLYRPGTADADDPEVAEAITFARADAELAEWFEHHCAFQKKVREEMRSIQAPPWLKNRILLGDGIVRMPTPTPIYRRPALLWLAAAVAAVVLVCTFLLAPWRGAPNVLANFQYRMVSSAIRDYRMDIRTHDMEQVRQYLASKGAPKDYQITSGLAKLSLTGAGALTWRGNPVSMVCFNRGDDQMLFLFVVQKSALRNPPPTSPDVTKEKGNVCVRWSQGDKAYILAGPEEEGFVQKYL